MDENTREGSEWRYGNAPIKKEELWLEGSCFDPQQCWMEIVKLWKEKIRYELGY